MVRAVTSTRGDQVLPLNRFSILRERRESKARQDLLKHAGVFAGMDCGGGVSPAAPDEPRWNEEQERPEDDRAAFGDENRLAACQNVLITRSQE